ncbi:LysR family transcriptional regulator [Roseixanthobacter glucoisosaccharinicivorans]|uniref:LysR family transcriptional regulator n=1 Tax=Roseixanthobacter glucoisosaccharinicivorans TaxID=3119923 RepID=UPI00372B38C2
MDLRDLRIFVAIAETGSLVASAKILHSSPPSLSARLKDLEGEFGTQLFDRQARGLALTDQGRELLSHAYAILKLSEDAKASMLSRGREPVGNVRFGVPGSLVGLLTVRLIETCQKNHPQVRLRVVESMSGYIASWLREGTLDAALVFGGGAATDKSASLQPIAEEDLYVSTYDPRVVAPHLTPAGEIRLRDVQHLRLVMPGPEHGLRSLLEATARRHAIPLNVAIELDASPQIFEMVRRGHGVTIGSLAARYASANANAAEDVKLHSFRLVDPGVTRTVYLATPLNRPSSRATMAVAQTAVDTLLSLADTEEWKARRLC